MALLSIVYSFCPVLRSPEIITDGPFQNVKGDLTKYHLDGPLENPYSTVKWDIISLGVSLEVNQ